MSDQAEFSPVSEEPSRIVEISQLAVYTHIYVDRLNSRVLDIVAETGKSSVLEVLDSTDDTPEQRAYEKRLARAIWHMVDTIEEDEVMPDLEAFACVGKKDLEKFGNKRIVASCIGSLGRLVMISDNLWAQVNVEDLEMELSSLELQLRGDVTSFVKGHRGCYIIGTNMGALFEIDTSLHKVGEVEDLDYSIKSILHKHSPYYVLDETETLLSLDERTYQVKEGGVIPGCDSIVGTHGANMVITRKGGTQLTSFDPQRFFEDKENDISFDRSVARGNGAVVNVDEPIQEACIFGRDYCAVSFANTEQGIRIYDLQINEPKFTLFANLPLFADESGSRVVCMTEGMEKFLMVGTSANEVFIFDYMEKKLLKRLRTEGTIQRLVMSDSGRLLALTWDESRQINTIEVFEERY